MDDIDAIAAMRVELWPDDTFEWHRADVILSIEGKAPGMTQFVTFVAEEAGGGLLGFAEVNMRSHADGCDCVHPVGYLEGWFVRAEARRTGVGGALVKAAEDWAREQGAVEFASDTWLDNPGSQAAHEALGFEEVDKCVHYRKSLG